MSGHDIIVIGASAGGVEAIRALVRDLPADLPASVFVVLHVSPDAPSLLPEILNRAGSLPATLAADGEPVVAGRIYVAPPDSHLLLERDRVRVFRGPIENRRGPAIDPLFRTAARAYGSRVVGVVLTGALDDGSRGLLAVRNCGGVAVVQDPLDALFPGMPSSAIATVAVDYVRPLAEIPVLLAELATQAAAASALVPVGELSDERSRRGELGARALDLLHEGAQQ